VVKRKINIVVRCVLVFLVFVSANNIIVVAQNSGKTFGCLGTYYHNKFENRRTSSGEVFSQKLYTAAHRTLPFHTIVRVTNNRTKKNILVKINDRCGRGNIIDLSKSAADKIGLNGSERVTVEVLGKDYIDIWQGQNAIINNRTMEDSLRNSYIDSLIVERKKGPEYLYFVRLMTIEGDKEVDNIKNKLNEEYREMLQVEKIYNEKFSYLNIGPFFSEKDVNFAIKQLKKNYPSAHLIKKKRQ
jgi:rare lipoprotein A